MLCHGVWTCPCLLLAYTQRPIDAPAQYLRESKVETEKINKHGSPSMEYIKCYCLFLVKT